MATQPDESSVANAAVFSDCRIDVGDPATIGEESRGQGAIPVPPRHAVMEYMTLFLLALVALKYQASRGQRAIPVTPYRAVMKYMTPSLLALVALKYQGNTESVFTENPVLIWCFLLGSIIYWLIMEWMKRMETRDGRCFHVLDRVALASVVLSIGSLASILLHRRFTFVPLMVLTPLTILMFVQPALYHAYTQVRSGIRGFNNYIWAKLAAP